MNVKEKLLQVQQKLNAPKKQFNKFGGYNYRNCEDILEAAKPLLNEVKATVTISDSIEIIGQRTYVKATATFIDCDSEDEINNIAYAREEESKKGMDASQLTGATSSYARKYALNGLFLIDDVKDADNQDNSGAGDMTKTDTKKSTQSGSTGKQQATSSQKTANNEQSQSTTGFMDAVKIAAINGLLQRKGVGAASMMRFYKVKDFSELTEEQYNDAVARLNKQQDKKKE